jgi:hypothetical protein
MRRRREHDLDVKAERDDDALHRREGDVLTRLDPADVLKGNVEEFGKSRLVILRSRRSSAICRVTRRTRSSSLPTRTRWTDVSLELNHHTW